jgi:hypothetical protein
MSDDHKTAGQQLQQAREQCHMSLMELSEKTKIPVQCLKDIEQDHYPNPQLSVYTRGHIKLYCEAVNTPAGPIIEALNEAGITYSASAIIKSPMPDSDNEKHYFRIEYLVAAAIWLGWLLYQYGYPEPTTLVTSSPAAEVTKAAPPLLPLKPVDSIPSNPPRVIKENHRE